MAQQIGSGAEKAADEGPDRIDGATPIGDIGAGSALGQLETQTVFFQVSSDPPGFNLGLGGYSERLAAGRATRETGHLGDQGIKVLDLQMTT
jgi:hypothetical protein